MLSDLIAELGINEEQFVKVIERGLSTLEHKKVFNQVVLVENFLVCKKLMLKRNKELEVEALKALEKDPITSTNQKKIEDPKETNKVLEKAELESEKAEIEHAIALSLAMQNELKSKLSVEEEMMQEAIKASLIEYDELKKINEEIKKIDDESLKIKEKEISTNNTSIKQNPEKQDSEKQDSEKQDSEKDKSILSNSKLEDEKNKEVMKNNEILKNSNPEKQIIVSKIIESRLLSKKVTDEEIQRKMDNGKEEVQELSDQSLQRINSQVKEVEDLREEKKRREEGRKKRREE